MQDNLGKEAKDKITGFSGIIVAFITYLTGCNQYGLASKTLENGKTIPTEWFDCSRIEITGIGISSSEVTDAEAPGGPNRDCPK